MPVSPKQFNPQTYMELLKLMGAEQEDNQRPGVIPSSAATNRVASYMPMSADQERSWNDQQAIAAEGDKRYEQEMAARSRGYSGQYPVEQQEAADQKDKMALAGEPQRQAGIGSVATAHEKGIQDRLAEEESFGRLQSLFGTTGQKGLTPSHGPAAKYVVPDTSWPAGAPLAEAHAKQTQEQINQWRASRAVTPDSTEVPQEQAPQSRMQQPQSVMSTITGKGAQPYSDLSSLIGAMGERAKYSLGVPTPLSAPIQESEFSKLEQIQGMFPGVRGIQGLIPVFRQHQSNIGYEMPSGSYQRLNGMEKMVLEAMDGLNDPAARVKIGADGKMQMTATPQSIERSKVALQDTLQKLRSARQYMEQIYPGIGGDQKSQTPAPGQGGGKRYLDDNGNPR